MKYSKTLWWKDYHIIKRNIQILESIMPMMNFPCKHVLYKTGDMTAPGAILDRNSEVVLSMCKICGKAEKEL